MKYLNLTTLGFMIIAAGAVLNTILYAVYSVRKPRLLELTGSHLNARAFFNPLYGLLLSSRMLNRLYDEGMSALIYVQGLALVGFLVSLAGMNAPRFGFCIAAIFLGYAILLSAMARYYRHDPALIDAVLSGSSSTTDEPVPTARQAFKLAWRHPASAMLSRIGVAIPLIALLAAIVLSLRASPAGN
ncbi:MAG: hypothetical protein WBF87_04540 [Mesorhizobium sp.]